MFCSKCGTQIPENSKFCINCGTQTGDVTPAEIRSVNINSWKSKLDTSTIISIIIAVVMILAMLAVPVFELCYGSGDTIDGSHTISLLGDNYTSDSYIDGRVAKCGINTSLRVAFIFMLASIIAVVIFKIMKKTRFAFISSIVNLAILLICNVFVYSVWGSESNWQYEHSTIMCAGNVICIGCAIALLVLSCSEYKKKNQ